jgi:hypothetical protein
VCEIEVVSNQSVIATISSFRFCKMVCLNCSEVLPLMFVDSANVSGTVLPGIVNDVSKKIPAGGSVSSAVAAAVRCPGAKGAVRRVKDAREPSLSMTFPAKVGPYELKIIRQPEDQHRARYLTEGSRGTVKDKSQQSHPTIKVTDQPVVFCYGGDKTCTFITTGRVRLMLKTQLSDLDKN